MSLSETQCFGELWRSRDKICWTWQSELQKSTCISLQVRGQGALQRTAGWRTRQSVLIWHKKRACDVSLVSSGRFSLSCRLMGDDQVPHDRRQEIKRFVFTFITHLSLIHHKFGPTSSIITIFPRCDPPASPQTLQWGIVGNECIGADWHFTYQAVSMSA